MNTSVPLEHVRLTRGTYHDSVTLMQVSREVAATPGVLAAQVAMATDLNVDVLRSMGFDVPEQAAPNDLVVALRAADEAALEVGLAAVENALAGGGGGSAVGGGGPDGATGGVMPRTTGSAVRAASADTARAAGDAGPVLALVSTPGAHAFTEALDALQNGAHVMVFSDNVPVAHEVRLKDEAAARGLLVMGPDCGTAVVGGVGLGFANVVVPGPVGIVAASGTGAQQMLCLLDAAGVGVRHCLGVGGRDLSAAVGGRSTRQALALLDADPTLQVIVVVSKPPDAAVEADLRAYAQTLSTPVLWALMGTGRADLTAAAAQVVAAAGGTWSSPTTWPAPQAPTGPFAVLRGAFAGGTLCDEAMVIASAVLGPLASNIPLDGAPALRTDLAVGPLEHAFVDFGDDGMTRGRPHPMIDGTLRAQWIARAAAEAGTPGQGVVLLLDVVLGHGAHPDPAPELASALQEAGRTAASRGVPFAAVVSLCGSSGDPQGLSRQAETLQAAGASVHLSNADAARAALELLAGTAFDGEGQA